MCGIIGYYTVNNNYNHNIEILTKTLIQRGPDDQGSFQGEKIALGHTRLSIIDLVSGEQPMFNENKSQVLVFNGEIYNFKELRTYLRSQGCVFSTQSDTEVILNGYGFWGLEILLQKLEGMFAFALWDKDKQQLFLARDKFGEKPLYYYKDDRGLFFASELKALQQIILKKEIALEALNLYFSLTYIPAPFTIYKDVYKLPAGNFLTIGDGEDFQMKVYYDTRKEFQKGREQMFTSYEDAQKELRRLLFESVEARMVADVPIGSFLSGGIDSSIISAIMAKISEKPINTFSIGFQEKEYDESERAQLVASHIKSNHTLHILKTEELLENVDKVLNYFDEPFGDSSAIPSFTVAQKAGEKVKVVLTGDCADELFAGYEKYLGNYYAERLNQLPNIARAGMAQVIRTIPHVSFTNHTLRKVKKVLRSASLQPEDRYVQLSSLGFDTLQKNSILKSKYHWNTSGFIKQYFDEVKTDGLTQYLYSDLKLVLEGDMLTKVDRMCMINSLEARVPFLDSKIVNFSFKLPPEYKLDGTNKKKILKDTFQDLLPAEVFKFSKKGFGLPLRIWFKNELKEELLELLEEEKINKQGIFNTQEINKIVHEHMSNKENHSAQLWLLFVFQKWYQKNIGIVREE